LVADPPTGTIAQLRDRAITGILEYVDATTDAIMALRVKDYYSIGDRRWLCVLQDGHIERHELVDPELEGLIDKYILSAGIAQDLNTPLFRSTLSKSGKINTRSIHRYQVAKLARRVSNLKSAGLTTAAAEDLIKQIKPNTIENLRDRAIIGMMLYAFASPSEISRFRTSNYLDNGEWCCIRLGRGIIEVPKTLHHLLRDYVGSDNPPEDGLIFRGGRGRGIPVSSIENMIRQRLKAVNPINGVRLQRWDI
jgi:hypothetical protein